MSDLNRLSEIEEVFDANGHHIGRIGVMASGGLKVFKKVSGTGFQQITDRQFSKSEKEAAKQHVNVTCAKAKPLGRPIQ